MIDVARAVLSDWPSILAVALIGLLVGRRLPSVEEIRQTIARHRTSLSGLPDDISADALSEVSRSAASSPSGRLWSFGVVLAMGVGMLTFLTFRAAFPLFPKWWGYFIGPVVVGPLVWILQAFRQRSILVELQRLSSRLHQAGSQLT